jgi:hypothetical protein
MVTTAKDGPWAQLIPGGHRLMLAGGIELKKVTADDSCAMFEINDVRYPPIICMMTLNEERTLLTPVKPNTGRHAMSMLKDCRHAVRDMSCQTCWTKWWRARALEIGLQPPPVVMM